MINPNWVIIGAIIAFLGSVSYVVDTLKGKVKPNRVSWGLWTTSSFIAFAAEVKQGVGIQSLMTFMVGFSPLLVFLASFINKKAYWQLGKFDLICGGFSILGLILWQLTGIGNLAIVFSIFADLSAGIPTLVKAYKYPETENYWEYATAAINAVLTMFTFTCWTLKYYGFPLYIFLYDFIGFMLIKFKFGKRIDRIAQVSR